MPVISRSKRHVPRAVNKYIFVPAVASHTSGLPEPTSAEINAGTDLTPEIFSVDGFTTSTTFVESSDAASFFKGKLAAYGEAADSTITFNASQDGQDVRQVLSQGLRGYLLIAVGGVEEGNLGEVYEVVVGSLDSTKTLDESAKIVVSFGIPSEPNLEFEIPSGVTL